MWQAQWVQARLKEVAPDLTITLQRIQTSGDKILDVPLVNVGGKGLFVKEIEEALLGETIDLAVHSMKDVPSVLPSGLEIVCVPPREDPRDVLISRDAVPLEKLERDSRIGTSSLRRQAQLLHAHSSFNIQMLRGNLDTRLRKLREGQYEAIVLAAAGLRRMGWDSDVTEYLSPGVSLPAVGQGALGIEARQEDLFIKDVLRHLDHPPTRMAVAAERAMLARLEGGCQVPIAGHATIEGSTLCLEGLIASVNGQRLIRDNVRGPIQEAEGLGVQLAEHLLSVGGQAILNELYGRA